MGTSTTGMSVMRVAPGRPHLQIKDADTCTNICVDKSCTCVCPASCCKAEGNGSVTLITNDCLECGSCRIICSEHLNVNWEYPRGGHGILFECGQHKRVSVLGRSRLAVGRIEGRV